MYLLTKVFLYFFLTIAWYYGFVFTSLAKKLVLWCIRCLLFLSRFIEHVTGARGEEKPVETVSQVATTSKGVTNADNKTNKGKLRQRIRKANEEPTFNTKLGTAIEDIIEETINEDKSDSQSSSPASPEKANVKSRRKKKGTKKEKVQPKSDEEDNGDFVFVKFNQKASKKNQKEQPSIITKSESQVSVENSVEENIGYSFVPVKERNRKDKNKPLLEKRNSEEALTAVIAQGITKKKDTGRTSIIDHFKTKNRRVSPVRKENNLNFLTEGCSYDVISTHQAQSTSKTEAKESKKVTSKISFASILTNSVPADFKFEETVTSEPCTTTDHVASFKLEKEVSSSVEVLSQSSKEFEEESEDSIEVAQIVTENNIILVGTDNYPFKTVEHSDQDFVKLTETEINIFPNNIRDNISHNTVEKYTEIRAEIINKSEEFEKVSNFTNSHFEKNILHSVINSSESSTEKISNNCTKNIFTKSINCEVIETKDLDEQKSDKLNDQGLDQGLTNIVKDFVGEERSTVVAENNIQEDSSAFKQVLIQNLVQNLKNPVDPSFTLRSFKGLSNHGNILKLNGHIEHPEKDISKEVENFIAAEAQQDFLFHSPTNPEIEEIREEIILAEAADLQQTIKPVVEQPFTVKSAYTTYRNYQESKKKSQTQNIEGNSEQANNHNKKTEEPHIESSIEDQIQSIEDQIIGKTLPLKDINIVLSENSVSVDTVGTNFNPPDNPNSKTVELVKEIEEESLSLDMNQIQVRVLTLNDKEHQESTIYRIEKKFILQFRLGPSLLGRRIKLYCNYPREINGVLEEFERGSYQLLSWCEDEGCKNADDTASFAQIVAQISGSFHYYFIYENETTEERQGSGYFIVDPILKYGTNEELPLDCIQCQTVLAKQLGSFSTWESKLRVAKESGYNVVHFTPIQELGASNSSYSLSEQLKLNPVFNEENGKKPTFEDIEKLTSKMRNEWKVLSVCDIVLNHTANESEWIQVHPEATYNCVNCPYLRPAYLLDAAFNQFSMEVKKGFYEDRGIPMEVSTEDHLKAIRYHFKVSALEPLKMQELFIVDVTKYVEQFLTLARKSPPISDNEKGSLPEIEIIQDPEYRRLKSTIDMELALKKYNSYRLDCFDEESRVRRCVENLKIKLDELNNSLIKEINDDLEVAVENVIAGIRYFRVQADGPKFRDITISHPLVYRYFTDHGTPNSINEYEELMYSENGKFLMAHNGWVMNSDPLKNFAEAGTKIYIRRELIAWGDSVKLRFGNKPEDSPFLWDFMRKYVEQTVKIFDGVRLDNCHSTPIPVAEYLLDCARRIRPDLYVAAELFTNSDLTDNIFVNRLGITSLIREAMSAWDSHEEGRLVYRYGGVPVGSFYQPKVRPLVPMVAHALFLDLTHDNPSPVEKRSVFDMLPSTALVNMACCASGSNRGYDELVPHHIHVVDETRQYTEWSDDASFAVGNVRYVNGNAGIIAAKKALNDLHFKLGAEGYNQVYVDQMDPDIVAVTRHNPETHVSYVLVAFTAFGHPDLQAGIDQRGIKPLRVEGVLDEIVLEASLSHKDVKSGGSIFTKFEKFTQDSKWINGLSEYQVSVKQHIQATQSDIFQEVNSGTNNVVQLNFKNFKPGSVAVIRVSLPDDVKESISKIRSLISKLSTKKGTELAQIVGKMTLADLNRSLYRCDQEERDEGNGFNAYDIPNFGPMVYCGLQGFMSLLANIRPSNDLGHPFCGNLRDGNWMIEYIWKRLKVDEGTKELGQWVEENTKYLHSIPRYLIPCYFDVIVTGLYVALLEQSFSLMSGFVKNGSTFVRGLSLGSLQFGGYIKSADLPVLSPNLAPPKPPTRKNKNGETVQACVSLSAGLPHFSVGYMRNWGRDTFIALRGLFILTGRFEEARQHILGYGACLRHGLIPNLLDGGRNSRFNCRDALWWWLYCIKSYCDEASNGTAILTDVVSRIFPTDDSSPQLPGAVDQPLQDIIQEALRVHFQGLKFRERNAGRQIDEHMTDAGFNNQIGIHPETGFVFGGNQWNCGTWMDKMGSSDKAGIKGKPATPRDGSAVELVGLSKAAVSWLWKLNREGKYPYEGVERTHKNGAVTKWTFKEWADKIQQHFEKNFWVGLIPTADETRPDLVNKKSIYKDTHGASQPWTDYQLRCNFPIAMVAAPEMFDPRHAWAALEQAEKYLLGPLGMKTLDPEDWNYRGDYDNSNDSSDSHVSHGFNYHQGPEWVWPVGFFLRAKLIFAAQNGMLKETLAMTKVILSRHFTELQTSPWRGLPELTNSNGSYCRDSSRTQAWSMSCVLEVLHDLQRIESKQIVVN